MQSSWCSWGMTCGLDGSEGTKEKRMGLLEQGPDSAPGCEQGLQTLYARQAARYGNVLPWAQEKFEQLLFSPGRLVSPQGMNCSVL